MGGRKQIFISVALKPVLHEVVSFFLPFRPDGLRSTCVWREHRNCVCFQLGSRILVHYALLCFMPFHHFCSDLICQEVLFFFSLSQLLFKISATILGANPWHCSVFRVKCSFDSHEIHCQYTLSQILKMIALRFHCFISIRIIFKCQVWLLTFRVCITYSH